MALGAKITADLTDGGEPNFPSSLGSAWAAILEAPVLATADASPLVNPDAQITRAGSHILERKNNRGTLLRLRCKYDDGVGTPTSPVVSVFGRKRMDSGGFTPWQKLVNEAGNGTATLTLDTTNDSTDGTWKWTTPNRVDHAWDLDGNDEVLVGVVTALSAVSGAVDTATIEGKII